MEQKDLNRFTTHDFYQATYMLYLGFDIVDRQLYDRTKTKITFERDPVRFPKTFAALHPNLFAENSPFLTQSLEQIGMEYYRSDAKKVLECYRTIKDLAFPRDRVNNAA